MVFKYRGQNIFYFFLQKKKKEKTCLLTVKKNVKLRNYNQVKVINYKNFLLSIKNVT